MKRTSVPTSDLTEELAAVQHDIWSHWMRYLFSVSVKNIDGSFTIPPDLVQRWQQQMETDYDQLSETERNSDREQARKVLAVIDTDLDKS